MQQYPFDPFNAIMHANYYEEDNNRSATCNLGIVQTTIDKWESRDKVVKLTESPLVVNPFTSVEKVDYNTKKICVVIDMSYYINPLIALEPTANLFE